MVQVDHVQICTPCLPNSLSHTYFEDKVLGILRSFHWFIPVANDWFIICLRRLCQGLAEELSAYLIGNTILCMPTQM